MIYSLTLKGSVPSKKNSKRQIYRGGRSYLVPSEAHETWHEAMLYSTAIRKCYKVKEEIKSVTISFFVKSKQRADLSNKAESVMDLLVDAGIIADDNYFVVPALYLYFAGVDTENPRASVVIETVV